MAELEERRARKRRDRASEEAARVLRRWLARPIGWLARLLGTLVALALVLSAALVVYSTTADFHARLLAWGVPELDRRMAGDLSVEASEGSPFTSLRLRNVTLGWHGEPIVQLPAATVALDWSALLAGQLRIARIELDAPRVVFREHPEAGWDWRLALAPLVPRPGEQRRRDDEPLPLVIERLALAQGALRIEAQGRPGISLAPIDAVARIDFGTKQVELESFVVSPGKSKLTGRGGFPFHGRWTVDVAIASLDPGDVARVAPQLADVLARIAPVTGGHASVSGEQRRIDVRGRLEWPGAALEFETEGEPNPFARDQGRLEARLEARALGNVLLDSPITGRTEAQLALTRGEGRYSMRLAPGRGGTLEVAGTLALGGVPATRARLTARAFDPARAWPARPEWQGALNGEGRITLRGRDRDDLAAELAVDLSASRVGTLSLRGAHLEAKLAGTRIGPLRLALESESGRVEVRGRLSTKPRAPVALAAEIDLDDLAPLLALVGREGGGALRGRITFDGRLDDGRLTSELAVEQLALERMRLERGRLEVDARGRFSKRLDLAIASARLEGAFGAWQLAEPTRLQAGSDVLAWSDARFTRGDASLSLDGRVARHGSQSLRLVGRALPIAEWVRLRSDLVPPDWLTEGELDLELALGGSAARPTVDLHLAPRGLTLAEHPIERVDATLRYDDGRLAAKLAAATPPDLQLDAEAQLPFALAWASSIVAQPTGPLDAHIEGDAGDLALLEPLLEGRVRELGGEAHGRLRLNGPLDALRPSGELTARALTGRPQRTGVRVIDGELEVELAPDRFFLRRATATVEGHAQTARFRASGDGPLPAALTRWTRPAPSDAAPSTDAEPIPDMEPPPDAEPTPDMEPPPDAEPIPDASGETYTTQIEIERWPLVDTRRNRLIVSGALTARGTFEAPRVEGHVEVVDGTLRPDLAFLSSGPPPRDPTIELAMPDDGSSKGNGNGGSPNGANLLSSFDALALDVKLDVGRDLWIRHEQAEVLLAGHVTARKQPGRELSLEGRIEAQRGFADLQSRRFRLIEGSLELVGGGKIDPLLDVLGRHKTRDYTIDARLTGTASNPVLLLSSDPSLSQEDILAVLLFGRPTGELTSDQQTTVGDRAATLASSIGLSVVGRSVASALHLDVLGLQIDELSNQRASVGAYVGRNIFVALAQDFGEERGQELTIEYEFWPGWSLVGSTTSQGTNSAGLVWRVRY